MSESFHVALYATANGGKREKEHRVVLYIASDKDWTEIQRQRNGNTGRPLAVADSTLECVAYRNESYRARCLRYSGVGRETLGGLAGDLVSLGFDQETVARFTNAAQPFLEGRS